jgi:hypothetical protein
MEWATLVPQRILVRAVIVYADESGTHDRTGKRAGSGYPTIAGFAAPPSEWEKFCVEWKAALNSYGVDHFHSRVLREAKAAIENNKPITEELKKNPYYGWSIARMEKFLMALANIAGKGNKVPIVGAIKMSVFNNLKAQLAVHNPKQIQLGEDPYQHAMREFFEHYHEETFNRWGNFKCPVTFFFDQSDDDKWRSAFREVYGAFQKKDLRMNGISFVDKKEEPHWPLQAADMLAFRMRQWTDNLARGEKPEPLNIDALLLRRGFNGSQMRNPTLRIHLQKTRHGQAQQTRGI